MGDDSLTFHEEINSYNSQNQINVMGEEKQSMKDNDVWDQISLPKGVKPNDCK